MATSCEELTHWKRLWCWEGLGAGGEGDNRGWDGWMASLTQWTWIWVNSGCWWWTGKPGVLGSQRVRHDWATELNWRMCLSDFQKKNIGILILSLSQMILCSLTDRHRLDLRLSINEKEIPKLQYKFLCNSVSLYSNRL